MRGLIRFLALAATPAAAQMQPDFTQIGAAVNAIAFPMTMNMCNAGLCGPQPGASGPRKSIGVPPAFIRGAKPLPASAPASAGIYQPTPALGRQALAGYVQRIRRANPGLADQVAREFGKHDYQAIYRSIVADDGFGSNSVSDAMAAYLTLTWMIANNANREPSAAEVLGVRRQIAARVAGNPALLANRAQLGEELKLLLVTTHAGFQSSRKEGTQRRYADGVAAMIRKHYDLDLRALRLTPNGFAPRA